MRVRKGSFGIPLGRVIAAIFAVILIIMGLVFLFTTLTGVFEPGCWKEPVKKIKDLKNGDNLVDFKGCVKKAIFTNDLGNVKDEIDIYKYCNEKDRLKGYGSFTVIIPVEDPELSAVSRVWDAISSGPLLEPVCVWRSYEVYKSEVFEGSDKEHCMHMEDYQKNRDPPIKIISECNP